MNGLLLDVRGVLRAWRAAPVPFLAAILAIALGTGVNTAVFAVAYGILLKPMPYPDAGRLVVMSLTGPDGTEFGVHIGEVDEWRARLRSVREAAGYASGESIVRGAGEPRTMRSAFVTATFFEVLGLPPTEGQTREFSEATAQAVVSRQLAVEAFSSTGGHAVGSPLTIAQTPYTVAAVMPQVFTFPAEDVAAWIPASTVNAVRGVGAPDARRFRIVARLKPGVTVEQARDDAERVIRETRGADPQARGGGRATVRTIEDSEVARVRPVLQALTAGGILVLLVSCANVATLLVGRAIGRSREMAVRLALGAPRLRLARSAMVESALVAIAGSLVGLVIGILSFRLFVGAAAGVLPRLATATIDWPVFAGSVATAGLVTVLCGIAPALRAIATDFAGAMADRGSSGSVAVRRLRSVLVVAQLALSIVLLIAAGLLGRTVANLLHEDAGIDPAGALSVRLMMSENPRFDATDRLPFVRSLLDRVRALPGVRAAGIGSSLPPRMAQVSLGINVVTDSHQDFQVYNLTSVTPGYLEALGARVTSGRLPTFQDHEAAEPIVLLSRAAARHMFQSRDPLGRQFPVSVPPGGKRTAKPRVIGVVDNVKYSGLDAPAGAALYVRWSDLPASVSYLVVRTSGDPMALAPTIGRIIRELDPAMPIPMISSLEDEMSRAVAERRLRVIPAVSFGALSLVVAFVGVFGTLARSVAERRREIAIRMAMGASPHRTLRMVVRQAAVLTAVAVVTGLVAATLAARGLASMLYGVTTHDPLTFVVVAVVVAVTALVACIVPARRASRVNPIELLQAE